MSDQASAGHARWPQLKRTKPGERAGSVAAVLAAVGFVGIALFQLALAAGADWGHAAWGGVDTELSSAQRIGSALAVLVWTAATLVVLGRAGLWGSGRSDARLYRWGTWAAAAVSGLGALANFASQSSYENFLLGPVALLLAILCIVVARSPANRDRVSEVTHRSAHA
jgi:hypothetical protein